MAIQMRLFTILYHLQIVENTSKGYDCGDYDVILEVTDANGCSKVSSSVNNN